MPFSITVGFWYFVCMASENFDKIVLPFKVKLMYYPQRAESDLFRSPRRAQRWHYVWLHIQCQTHDCSFGSFMCSSSRLCWWIMLNSAFFQHFDIPIFALLLQNYDKCRASGSFGRRIQFQNFPQNRVRTVESEFRHALVSPSILTSRRKKRLLTRF